MHDFQRDMNATVSRVLRACTASENRAGPTVMPEHRRRPHTSEVNYSFPASCCEPHNYLSCPPLASGGHVGLQHLLGAMAGKTRKGIHMNGHECLKACMRGKKLSIQVKITSSTNNYTGSGVLEGFWGVLRAIRGVFHVKYAFDTQNPIRHRKPHSTIKPGFISKMYL